jgi:protein HIRA/HIR1
MHLLKPFWISGDGADGDGHPIFSIDVHPDGTRFATGGIGTDNAGRISIWNMKPLLSSKFAKDETIPKLLTQMDHHLGCVNCVRWSNSGTYLASGSDDKLVGN